MTSPTISPPEADQHSRPAQGQPAKDGLNIGHGMKAWLKQKQTWAICGLAVLLLCFAIARQLEHRKRLATEQKLVQTIQAKQVIEAQLSAEQSRSQQLAEALDLKTQEMEQVVKRLEEEAQTVEQLQGRLVQMENQISQFQAELVLAMRDREELAQRVQGQPGAETVQLDKITVSVPTSSAPGAGKVIQVNTEWRFVVIDLGWDALAIGDVLGVYRGDELVAKIQVERVQEQVAAARILPEYQTVEIAVSDRVAKL